MWLPARLCRASTDTGGDLAAGDLNCNETPKVGVCSEVTEHAQKATDWSAGPGLDWGEEPTAWVGRYEQPLVG